jgi:hypothetical protein
MGYLIKEEKEIEKIIVTVPLTDVLLLNTNPYTLIPANSLNEKVLLSAHLSIADPIGSINGFRHFYLGYRPDLYPAAVYDAAIGDINDVDAIYSFLVDASHPPNRFGAKNLYRIYPFQIFSEDLPVANCDLIVTMYFLV